MTRNNKPPLAFRPVQQALDATGYGPDVYPDKTFLRDYNAGFIPKPTVDATAEEIDNAVLAAELCARARPDGQPCPAVKGRLRAMNPDPGATRELRATLREGVKNLLKRPETGPAAPRINVYSHRAIEALLPLSPEPVVGMVAHLAQIRGLSQDQIVAFLKDVQEATGGKRAWRTGLRDAFGVMCAEMGQPLSPLSQKALEEAFLSANPRARRLRELMEEQGYKPVPTRGDGMVSLIDMVSTANLTDTDRALRLLDESSDVVLRQSVLRVGQARRTGRFPHEDHHLQRCRVAADWDALITCQILDPRTSAWWKAAYGDFRPLLGIATEVMAEVARGAREE
ncbi:MULTISPECIES: hypothetical protein [Streptomyces]|uniref:Uncharacterized protein n=1 Tax=Streptomyces flavovirens TaxID=52258 RepID=A0ABV8N1R1_9ACTN|nr:hypothetical protein [Streptomyces sp. MBT51]MBK3594319.1 hypothetical protein [Streptomyces sp. MBT51]